MFSSLFGKRRSSPVDDDVPPIPGATTGAADDGFVVVGGGPPRTNLYPSASGGSVPYPQRPAPQPPAQRKTIDQSFHYLQGVPFKMSGELQMSTNKEAYATQISDLLAFLTNKAKLSSYEYDFTVERSVLKEC